MNIFIKKLSYDTTEATLRAAFEAFGKVTNCNIVMDKVANCSKGFGFVEMPDDKKAAKIEIAGVEDITVDRDDNFAVFISYPRGAERDGKPFETGIYTLELDKDNFQPKLISQDFNAPFLPHGISLIQLDSNHHKLFVVNHGEGESIEVFDLYNKDSLVHDKTLEHELIYSANDIVALSENEFYFTNDHYYSSTFGQLMENYLGLSKCETIYFDGKDYRVVNDDLAYANGINYDKKRNLMFIASPRGFLIGVYEKAENGDLKYIESIDCGTGVDNIEFDDEGNIWVGCHPNLLAFNAYNKGQKDKAPSELIKIDYRGKGDYEVTSTYMDDGSAISACTVAATYKDLILVGNVLDDHFLIFKK